MSKRTSTVSILGDLITADHAEVTYEVARNLSRPEISDVAYKLKQQGRTCYGCALKSAAHCVCTIIVLKVGYL